ncbi:RNA polymerase subunit sigma-70 [Halorubrum ezzemoulense]|nr:RNA polymerase subunit sigma-70 [Halorubrum ezzemoulense]MDB9260372.1 RNA polymerase subunit sigma-70 [Halorubrum ezzemoulense]MDB9263667.1 RNA polymerase subunit sigma-70 [Halorubrum ezzemoulense]MDB9267316.1 RNA polymerase subunit sigma-70 [Halorubrum ezzemoulense]MDB9270733.1 RNA polymerase subunit sigma-70 [Halorubrum ezzemoulense]
MLRTLAKSSQQIYTKSNSFACCTELCKHRMYEVCGEKELKVILALDQGDSISGVARKIDENRETIRRVVNRLEEADYVAYDDGLQLLDQTVRDVGLEFLTAAADISPPSISEAYVLPQFAGLNYAFTSIDAVYVWTRGGYQVARDPEDYPLFIAVREQDVDAWKTFFDRFGIPTAEERQPAEDLDGAIQVVLEPRPQIDAEMVDGRPVIPLQETVAFANEYYATFQSALDMLGRMYDDVDTDANYRREPA